MINIFSRKRLRGCFLALNCLCGLFLNDLNGSTINVPGDVATIQGAVDLAADGDTIQIAGGTYIEQVQIVNKSIDLVGAGQDVTIIQSPDASTPLTQFFVYTGYDFWCVLMIDNQAAPTAQTVNISDLTVDGNNQQDTTTLPAPSPGFYGNSDRFFAIGYHNASGDIQNVHTTSTRQSINFNELAGGGLICAADTGTVVCNLDSSLIDFYQRSGIDCRGPNLEANITNSTVDRGYVLTMNTTTATPNGIQFSGGTIGSIVNCTVSGNIGTVPEAGGSGIIPFGAGENMIVSGNTLNNNENGIAAIQCGNNLTISNNTLNFTTDIGVNEIEGIIVQDTSGLTTISTNIINNMADVNMDLSSTDNQVFQLMNNQFNGSEVGLLITGNVSTGPQITMNNDSFSCTAEYYIQEVTAPNDVWPSTASVTFDGLISGSMTMAQFEAVLAKIVDKNSDPSLGLVLSFVAPVNPLPAAMYVGMIKTEYNRPSYVLVSEWTASPSSDVVLYRIYEGTTLIDEVIAGFPFVSYSCIGTKLEALQFNIVAVNLNGDESVPLPITIIME